MDTPLRAHASAPTALKQQHSHNPTHHPACPAQEIVDKEGVLGLMGRGLKTKLLANGMQVRELGRCARSERYACARLVQQG